MKEPTHKILKGAQISGTRFSLPQNKAESNANAGEGVSDYQRGLEDGRHQGYEAGLQEGLEVGFQKGRTVVHNQFKDSLSMLNLIAAVFQIKKEELFEQIKPEIIKFNINLMEKLLQQQLMKPKVFASLIEKLLQQMEAIVKEVPINIIVSPEDAMMLKANMQTLGTLSEALAQVNLIEESSMTRGNCRLETPLGMLNYDISRLLKDLEIKLLEV